MPRKAAWTILSTTPTELIFVEKLSSVNRKQNFEYTVVAQSVLDSNDHSSLAQLCSSRSLRNWMNLHDTRPRTHASDFFGKDCRCSEELSESFIIPSICLDNSEIHFSILKMPILFSLSCQMRPKVIYPFLCNLLYHSFVVETHANFILLSKRQECLIHFKTKNYYINHVEISLSSEH